MHEWGRVMRLPYVQLAEKFIEAQSRIVATKLGVNRVSAIGMGAQLFAFAIQATGSDDAPPDGVFDGDDAADIIEAGMEWGGERGKAFGAFVRADVIEQLQNGARVRGMDRYRDAWEKQQKRKDGLAAHLSAPEQSAARAEHARKAAQARWGMPTDAQPMPINAPSMPKDAQGHAQPMLSNAQNAPKTETETETETEKKPLLPAAAVSVVPDAEEAERQLQGDEGTFPPTGLGFCGWWNTARVLQGLTAEIFNVAETAQWADRCIAEVGEERFWRAADAFLRDEFWRPKGWPLQVFKSDSVWRTRASDAPPQKRVRQ
jgi:hypothetical protein